MDREGNSRALNPEIKIVRLAELESFVSSVDFSRMPVVPITSSRVQSYIENPFGRPDDAVLLLAYHDNRLVAFRSLFAGEVATGNEKIRFGWCSGNWVHPEYRKRGLSQLLLQKAYIEWDKKLMFTNYAPESESLYIKTGLFKEIHRFMGVRGYLFLKRAKLQSMVSKKILPGFLFKPVVYFISLFVKIRSFSPGSQPGVTHQFDELQYPDKECFEFLQKQEKHFLFIRNEEQWNWIFKFPWISDSNAELKSRYPFSSASDVFLYQTVKIHKGDEMTGFFIFAVREGHLKTLFFIYQPGLEKEIAEYIKHYAFKRKIEVVTVYNCEIAECILNNKTPFLYVKNFGQKIYSSFDIQDAGDYLYRDGEGDYIFT